ncbi:SirB2 family protein [Massilia antarctica]|uniref:SirB2 family protein n=1 Tax=Massilia antarctica TaxID=2765360 RepID=UPI0006BB5EAA|nr:SirB2 family protein [Massilia sp. H27-R4]MCY0914465.1 SirB2 family protein [Massilia sp. H27-R4]CUI03151.1 FIG002082: Protein SirB2 [Janthinobacterium sp. CG23_2]CUU26937.1 FIG002082: Protein SirB2 [Janthinobacterium sp. CG23_2]
MEYLAVKHLHMSCAALSIGLFALRGVWMLRGSPQLAQRWVKIAPHLVDTVLLASALTMVVWSGQYPFVQSWLGAKVVALVVYIVLGAVALKPGRPKQVRAIAFGAALLTVAYIVAVALTRRVLIVV